MDRCEVLIKLKRWFAGNHPLSHCVKFNFDGVCNLEKAYMAKTMALWHGLMYCKYLGLSKVETEGDDFNVLNSLKMDLLDLSEIGGLLDGIMLMLPD
ncbi:hypothetical protein M0R45_030413 [Rubus argutus]|uniref:Uncharacterized protein n=1 Tax=Rubus argutus TaxID=59490 RepID=A0AAW1WAM2_RUBAR